MIRLLKVEVAYHFVAIEGDDIAELVSNPIIVAAGDWPSYSSGESKLAVDKYIEEIETKLSAVMINESHPLSEEPPVEPPIVEPLIVKESDGNQDS